ncbi:MAG: response regulator, partial [Candidatus Methanoplasma sp.]|nr:response regulator [Candidatus Methanoplasma sp.]
MRILIADDNIALQDVLAEVVSDAGHTVERASSADTALSSVDFFNPDVIILDIDMDGGRGLTLLDRMQNRVPVVDTPVIVIRSWNRQIPQDNYVIRGHINKPFTKSDILDSIDGILIEEASGEEAAKAADESEDRTDRPPKVTLADKGIVFGKSYLLFQSIPDKVYDLVSQFDDEGYDVLVVTTRKRKTIIERFKNNDIEALTMTIKFLGGHLNIYGLGTMIDNVTEFIGRSERPVVAFDDLNRIIDRNGINSVLTAMHQLVTDK